jgi:hypothetical protein
VQQSQQALGGPWGPRAGTGAQGVGPRGEQVAGA